VSAENTGNRRNGEYDTIVYVADGVTYMLLDVDRDPNALPAIRAYAVACQKSDPDLARRLGNILLDKHIEKHIEKHAEHWNPESFTTTESSATGRSSTTSNEIES
jgi:hypothetical protein